MAAILKVGLAGLQDGAGIEEFVAGSGLISLTTHHPNFAKEPSPSMVSGATVARFEEVQKSHQLHGPYVAVRVFVDSFARHVAVQKVMHGIHGCQKLATAFRHKGRLTVSARGCLVPEREPGYCLLRAREEVAGRGPPPTGSRVEASLSSLQ